jgi:chorismate synthase
MRYMDAGETHGLGLVAVVDDVPAGLRINPQNIDDDIARWDRLHGRPAQQRAYEGIELLAGVREGRTTGAPVGLCLARAEAPDESTLDRQRSIPRPGTSELAGALKRDLDDCGDICDRADARVGAMRVAAAGVAREFLADLGVEIHSYVTRIGDAAMREEPDASERFAYTPLDIEMSSLRCPSAQATRAMEAQVDQAVSEGDTLDGTFRVAITGLVPGLGDDMRSGGSVLPLLATAAFSVEGVRGVEFACATDGLRGSQATDAAACTSMGFTRSSNRSGGVEGGVSTGLPVVMTVSVAAPPALNKAVSALDMETLESAACTPGHFDACRVPSVAVAVESELAFALAQAYRAKFGGDCMGDVHAALDAYNARLARAAR